MRFSWSRLIFFSASLFWDFVLRPGERVFLERYLDTPNRFKFETYTVGGNSEEVKKAIELNGLIKIDLEKCWSGPID